MMTMLAVPAAARCLLLSSDTVSKGPGNTLKQSVLEQSDLTAMLYALRLHFCPKCCILTLPAFSLPKSVSR